MTERLLQYIWQFQYFNTQSLQTTEGQPLLIIHPGRYNTNQGPDFLNGKIKIGDTTWAGSIELHINGSEWLQHKHSADKNYNNVILHVVWNNDIDLHLPFPSLELKNIVSKMLLEKYAGLMHAQNFIPCESQLPAVDKLTITAWKERLVVERLQSKTKYIHELVRQSNNHWEETFWRMLARSFGVKINSDAFEKIAQSISLTMLSKHKNSLIQLEALLMGQAGLLEATFADGYPQMLQKEYRFLQKKYGLQKVHQSLFFLRMRPANFPTVRLAQLAALIHQSTHLFSSIRDAENLKGLKDLFSVTANDYWHYHYMFDETTSFKKKTIGEQMINNILINTVIPTLYAYARINKEEGLKAKAIDWLQQVEPESNNITKGFCSLSMENKSAWDSQALLHLKTEYCDKKRCLQCAIGNALLKS